MAEKEFSLHLFAHLSDMKVGTFGHTLVDAHIYTKKADGSMEEYDHIPGLIEQTKRKIKPLPELKIDSSIKTLEDVMDLLDKDTETIMSKFELKNYNPEPFIPFKVAV